MLIELKFHSVNCCKVKQDVALQGIVAYHLQLRKIHELSAVVRIRMEKNMIFNSNGASLLDENNLVWKILTQGS